MKLGRESTLPSYETVRRIILGISDPTERKIKFLALLSSSIPKIRKREKGEPVLTGGSAVEIYLDGVLRSGDMDLVYNVADLKGILKSWKFDLGGAFRSYVNYDLGLAVDLVGEHLNGSRERLTTIITDYGPARVIGVEDLIIKRLSSAKFWNVSTDFEQAFLLARSQEEKIDWEYLEEKAKIEDVADYMKKIKRSLKKGRNSRK